MKAKPNTMNKDKEPLLSFNDWFHKKTVNIKVDDYAKYHTQWHLNKVKEVVCEEADTTQKECHYTGVRAGGSYFISIVDKQSITNAINSYIDENLNS